MMETMEHIKELGGQMKTKNKEILELKQQLWTEREKVRQLRKLLRTLGQGSDARQKSLCVIGRYGLNPAYESGGLD